MTLRLINLVWDDRKRLGLTDCESAILVKIAALTKKISIPIHFSILTLSREIGYSRARLNESLEGLIDKHLVFRQKFPGFLKDYDFKEDFKLKSYRLNSRAFITHPKEGEIKPCPTL